jgi:uncharacterized membrane protein YqhA
MKVILEKSRYLTLIAVVALLAAALGALIIGGMKTYYLLRLIYETAGKADELYQYLIQVVDIFLIALTLYFFAVGIYELFIGDLNLPDWIQVTDLQMLKVKLSNLILLVICIFFVEILISGVSGSDLLYSALSIALVGGVLIAFSWVGRGH